MNTLLSHEWLSPIGGSENVFEELTAAYPGAQRVCLWNDAPQRFGHNVDETWLARSPLRRKKPAALPFMHSAWNRVDLTAHDRVISSSHAFGHHLAARAASEGREAYAYVHSPARYVWAPEHDHRGQNPLVAVAATWMKRVDRRAVHPDVHYAANSQFVRDRIQSSWGQDATVIYPPVDVERVQGSGSWYERLDQPQAALANSLPSDFVLGASRFVEYKRLDFTIEIGAALGLPVVLCGSGPDEGRLRSIAESAGVPVFFTGRVSDELLYWLYGAASLFAFLAIEDFGIMPVEAIACGTPVIVNELGGASEIVEATSGGMTADPSDRTSTARAAEQALSVDMRAPTASARQFSPQAFRERIYEWAGKDS